MSLITRCPACGTLFKLVPDQLRISSGWVRCGQCHLVFDAQSHMLSDADAVAVEVAAARQALAARAAAIKTATEQNAAKAQTPDPAAPASTPSPPKPRQASAVTPAEIARWRDERSGQAASGAEPSASDAARAQEDDGIEVQEMDLHFGDLPEFQTLLDQQDAKPDAAAPVEEPQETKEADAPQSQEAKDDASENAAPAAEAPEEAPSFVREARRRAFWQSAPVRALLWLLLGVLAAALALQVALTRRDWLATAYPATEPALQLLCRVAGCQVGPYRHLDGMAVESSSFTRVTGNVYQLSVTLRNNAALPVAMPALDLTLSDMQGQPVLRRVIAPSEMGAPATLAAGGEFAGTARLTLTPLPDSAAVIGYRVEAFYP